MTPERWQQVKAALVVALELTPPDRAAYLDQACAGDQGLRDELERLLMADEVAGAAFLASYNGGVFKLAGAYNASQLLKGA